jgi:uncharacterized protein YjiS (DUF1127 family)
MKKLLERLLHAFQAARQRQIDHRLLSELDAQTLRDIGLDPAADPARRDALSKRLQFGLY